MRRSRVTGLLLVLAAALPALAHAQETTVILVRHAEKMDGPGDVALTEAGKQRAARLATMLRHAGVEAIYSTPYTRTKDTAQPIAQALGLELILTPVTTGTNFATSVTQQILKDHKGKTVLVVGHSNTTPEVIQALGAAAVPPIADAEYDNLYVVRIGGEGKVRLIRAKY